MKKIILASQSPRRKELLTQIGIEFDCMPAYGEESSTGRTPKEIVMELAEKKAEEIRQKVQNQWILAADTVVAYENRILGKPENKKHAEEMLSALQDNVHEVYTGVCLINQESGEKINFAECTKVYMNKMSMEEIKDYIASNEPMDKANGHIWNTNKKRYAWEGKAGGYGIQDTFGMKYIKRIEGDYYNVVGLPVNRVYQELKKWI